MELLNIFANCFSSIKQDDYLFDGHEKPCNISAVRSAQGISNAVVELLRTAEKDDPMLRSQLTMLSAAKARPRGREMIGSVLGEFIDKAVEATHSNFDFPHDYPYFTAGFATIVAVGVLVLVSPWAVEALGFAELGPVAARDKRMQACFGSCV
ncbi:hypothetical protein PspLS_11474 [Pyricularia sp. CBS 133598]|nr:hypothetical protein PspLS_11474 [Pyricularia sp. CBS 133598]